MKRYLLILLIALLCLAGFSTPALAGTVVVVKSGRYYTATATAITTVTTTTIIASGWWHGQATTGITATGKPAGGD